MLPVMSLIPVRRFAWIYRNPTGLEKLIYSPHIIMRKSLN